MIVWWQDWRYMLPRGCEEKMKGNIIRSDSRGEYYTDEGCYILELSNFAQDKAVSIARVRLEPGVTTRRHRLPGVLRSAT